MAVGLLGIGRRVVEGVGIVLLDDAAELYRVGPALTLNRLAEQLGGLVRGADVATVVLEELAVKPVGAGKLAKLLLKRSKAKNSFAGHRHKLAVL